MSEPLTLNFRRCVGLYPTGVAVVACEGAGDPAGMTINSFVSVSLDPLLILVSLHSRSRTLEAIRRAPRVAISLLRHAQLDAAVRFSEPQADFPHELVERSGDFLAVPDALAVLKCETEQLLELGDHHLVVARVLDFESRQGEPLLFYRGEFGTLTAISDDEFDDLATAMADLRRQAAAVGDEPSRDGAARSVSSGDA
jgi:flavin reductase (DIM6/NTAB) family NADH-FMN oxidoreductase RutF